jgi:tetratricopeptide (TPR) repeat protein
MKRFFRKALIGSVWTLGIVAVLLLLFYAEEDWRGAHDWTVCQKELAAKGESLDLRQLVPPGRPEDDLSKVPIFAEDYEMSRVYQTTGHYPKKGPRISMIDINLGSRVPTPRLSSQPERWSIDLAEWQKFYRSVRESKLPAKVGTPAEDVIKALSQYDSEIDEIDHAINSPGAYWPDDPYWGIWQHLSTVADVLRLKAVAYLSNSQSHEALACYLLAIQLASPEKNCPFGYDFFLHHVMVSHAILMEGLRRHSWNLPQIKQMEEILASLNLLEDSAFDLRLNRANIFASLEKIENRSRSLEGNEDPGIYLVSEYRWIRPSGWWSEEQSFYSRSVQTHIEAFHPARGLMDRAAFPSRVPHERWELPADVNFPKLIYIPLASEMEFGLDTLGPSFAKAETYRRLALLACRLEEFRIGHGQYPDKLEELPDLPAHLNQEVLSETPLRYQRKGEGYLLYSVGWDQKDDGGVMDDNDKVGDWAWPSP